MKFWVGTTDNDWFRFLESIQPPVGEVNFWQPSEKLPFTDLPPGAPFLFKLKSPHHCIAGGGYYLRSEVLPTSLAWDSFGEMNGAATREALFRRLAKLSQSQGSDPRIVCNMLTQPFFLPKAAWVPVADEFAANIVRGKYFDTADVVGQRLWDRVALAMQSAQQCTGQAIAMPTPSPYGSPHLHWPRLGQASFRACVAAAYQQRCAITGENTLPVLEAAHIKPFAENGPHEVRNGLFLRSDFHKLFDRGLVTITPDRVVQVSPQIRQSYFNGKAYYRLDGKPLAVLPEDQGELPDPELLAWHNQHRFVG